MFKRQTRPELYIDPHDREAARVALITIMERNAGKCLLPDFIPGMTETDLVRHLQDRTQDGEEILTRAQEAQRMVSGREARSAFARARRAIRRLILG